MATQTKTNPIEPRIEPEVDYVHFDFAAARRCRRAPRNSAGPSRREVMQMLGAGLLIAVAADGSIAQVPPPGRGRGGRGGGRGGGGGGAQTISARLHIGADGVITVMTGKVECGQGARAEHTQAAAEELGVALAQVRLIMADTGLVPDDGGTFGSASTPRSVPAVRQGCAAARRLLQQFAASQWTISADTIKVADGKAIDPSSKRTLSYADLAADPDAAKGLAGPVPTDVAFVKVSEWKVMGVSTPRPNGHDIVTGAHQYPSDITLPGMLYGKILRAPSYGAKLESIDLVPAKAMRDVVVVQDGSFVAVAAPTTYKADDALSAIADTAKWTPAPHPSSAKLWDYLREHVRGAIANQFAADVSKAAKSVKQTYHVAYVQHTPMEPRAAVAHWENGKVTVWTATQNPFGVRGEVARALNVASENVRVIVPDFGGGFGGKHTGECAVECARLAQAAGKPVKLRWTRQEEFTWAYFRPAALIDAEASLDEKGNISSWHYININSGGNEVAPAYNFAKVDARYVQSDPPLRHGSYRALATTANNFGREVFMDELAVAAGRDPLEFRVAHLENPRLRAVLEEAAKRFDWATRSRQKQPNTGVGLACGTDKGSYVAACVEVAIDPKDQSISVKRACQVFECGKIVNPANLMRQVSGGLVMGLGPALREEMIFEGGKMLNAKLADYRVPRMEDLPELDVHLLDRPDLPSAGAGETPVIVIAPAIANAVFAATGVRVRSMPIKLPPPT